MKRDCDRGVGVDGWLIDDDELLNERNDVTAAVMRVERHQNFTVFPFPLRRLKRPWCFNADRYVLKDGGLLKCRCRIYTV